MRKIKMLAVCAVFVVLAACDSGPKVVEAVPSTSGNAGEGAPAGGGSVLDELAAAQQMSGENQQHKVTVQEVLHTDKYTYLNVEENGQNFWIAVQKMDAAKGETLYYTGGLLKQNFQSREFNRVFETLYLVSNIQKQPGAAATGSGQMTQEGGAVSLDPPKDVKLAEGAIKISDLLANKAKYAGKPVKITGKVVKINPNIMGRNWLHVTDGSANNFDLTVTTSENIPLGHIVTLEGTVALDKDFGAGYKYDIILEGAALR